MNKLDYLKACFQALKPMENISWYVNMFAIPVPAVKDISTMKHLDLICQQDGLKVVLSTPEGNVLENIVDYQKGKPLFSMEDTLKVDSSWLPSIKETSEKRLGGLIINAVVLYPVVKDKLPYLNTPITEKKIEALFASKMIDVSESKSPDKDILVSDYVDFMDRLWFFTSVADLIVMASSYKTISAPVGADALAKKLIEENKDNINDPVVVAQILGKLTDLHDDQLKDDPVAKRMFDKKALTARKKQYLMYGETNDFVTSHQSNPVLTPMVKGIDTSEDIFPLYMNDLRYASYSRGHSTQLSGYSYKILQRSLAGLEITDTPCDTKLGLVRLVSKPEKLVGRYIAVAGKWKLVETPDEAGAYLGKLVTGRSPMFCTTSNDNEICYACLGEMYKGQTNAMNNLAANFSGELMSLFLKRMHTSGFSLTKIDSNDLFN